MRVVCALALACFVTAADAQVPASEYAERRGALVTAMPDGVLLALGAPEPVEDYLSFTQRSSFEYLTGINEPNAALVIVKRGTSTDIIFVEPNDAGQAVWTGSRMGPAGATSRTGIAARTRDGLRVALDTLLRDTTTLLVVGTLTGSGEASTADAQYVQSLVAAHPGVRVVDGASMVERLRGRKSVAERALIRRAAGITVQAERAAFGVVAPRVNEYEVQAEIEYTFRRNGADHPSFSSIVGSGPNATTLHYNADDRIMQSGELVVMDVGASYLGYAADVTRTVPVSGTYSADQRAVYQIVRDAQAAAERQATLWTPARRMSDSATAVLAAGLARLGLIESPSAMYECGLPVDSAGAKAPLCPQYSMYYMHGLGHGIGLDVHDPDQFYFTGRIEPGSAFTIEPGLYVRANLPAIVPPSARNRAMLAAVGPAMARYANVGVRIEDDYIADDDGVHWISTAPREAAEIETAIKRARRLPAVHNPVADADRFR